MLEVKRPKCEYFHNPLGIDVRKPRISWEIESDRRGVMQAAYQLQVAEDEDFRSVLWDSSRVASDRSVHVEVDALEMEPCKRYFYRIKVWDRDGNVSPWSETAYWETGLLSPDRWKAEWIAAPAKLQEEDPEASPMLRNAFSVSGKVNRARIYVTSLGLYELRLNGKRVGDAYFTPGWTSYRQRLQYQTYDVTGDLAEGRNALGITLGNGWYKGNLAWTGQKEIYGDRTAALLELHVWYEDGKKEMIATDRSWKAATGPIRMSEIYHGEHYDARLEKEGWSTGDYADDDWQPVEVLEHSRDILISQQNEPVRKMEEITPKEIIRTPAGETVLDFGQNMVGWVRFSVRGEAGATVTLQHAEVLDQEGNFYTANLRSARQTVTYVLKGGGVETYEPHFTFQGFRYVKLQGFPEPVRVEDFAGIVLHSDMPATGTFECSNPLVNQLHHNIVWGQKGNFLDVPTDCPQRDERLGWTGDAQMFIRTAAYLTNIGPFFTKWLHDLKADQLENGGVPFVIPQVLDKTGEKLGGTTHSSAAWGDAAVICPWTLYLCYGDRRILEQQYDSMKAWVEYMRNEGEDEYLWNTGFQLGDWLALDSKPDSYVGATDTDYIATAFYAWSTELLAKTADIIGKKQDAKEYKFLHECIVEAFRKEFVTPSGRLAVQTQTAHVLALMFNLVDGTVRQRTAGRLAELIEEQDCHLTTGFVGTPYLNLVLSENGYHDLACKLLLKTDYPSWLYQITKGATTVWEHWDGIKEDGSFWSKDMNSFNHYAYGSIGEWLYRVLAGIDTDDAKTGYKHIHIRPRPGAELTRVEASLKSMYGEIVSSWKREGQQMEIRVNIPPNTTATIVLPGAERSRVKEGQTSLDQCEGIESCAETNEGLVLEAGSGHYCFTYPV